MVDNRENVIDSRDVIDRIKELEAEREEHSDAGTLIGGWFGSDGEGELITLYALAKQGETFDDWHHGLMMIRDDYFRQYAIHQAMNSGMSVGPRYSSHFVNFDEITSTWPFSCIDWDRAARELQTDYTDIEYNGVTYWVR